MKIISFVLLTLISASVLSGEYKRDITIPPYDEDDAFYCRIWVPVENVNSVRAEINILNKQHKPIRAFFKGVLNKGYHNFFWDKKDDSGKFVDSGDYKYQLIINDKRQTVKPLDILFIKGEKDARYHIDSANTLTLDIQADSVIASVALYTKTGYAAKEMAVDTVLYRGRHKFHWNEQWPYRYGSFIWHTKIYDYTNEVRFTRKPPGMK